MTGCNEILMRIERFNQTKGGGVIVERRNGAFSLRLKATGAPVARLKPTGLGDEVEIFYWSPHSRWAKAGQMGGTILPIENALALIAAEPIFWIWAR